MIYYLAEFSALFALHAVLFYLLLRENKNYNFIRFYFLGSIVTSLSLPLIPQLFPASETIIVTLIPLITIGAQSLETATQSIGTDSFSWQKLLLFSYYFISVVFLFRVLYSLIKIYKIITNGEAKDFHGHKIVFSKSALNPCSFFSYIILPKSNNYDEKIVQTILEHEALHIKFGHTPEKLVWEIFGVLVWWHPSYWYLKTQVALNHEFQVDSYMTISKDYQAYKTTLVNLAINPANIQLVNPITSHIKKRIKMMNNNKSFDPKKYLVLALLIIGGSLLIHSCQKDESSERQIKIEQRATSNVTTEVKQLTNKFLSDTVIVWNPETMVESMQIVYRMPEKQAQFPGCEDIYIPKEKIECSNEKLLSYIYGNVKYPEIAREQKEEGIVVVKLAINQKGKIEWFEFAKSPSESLKSAVKTMLQQMKKDITWLPGEIDGEIVMSELIIPVKFQLE